MITFENETVSGLIKKNLLSFSRDFHLVFTYHCKSVDFILSLTDTNRVEFYAKVQGYSFPCCSWFVTRKTKIASLIDEVYKRL